MKILIFVQLVNRQKRSKKRAPVPLTADMLNELNKNHMGGFENYGRDEFYNPEDTWSDTKHPIKPKVCRESFLRKIFYFAKKFNRNIDTIKKLFSDCSVALHQLHAWFELEYIRQLAVAAPSESRTAAPLLR